MRKKQPSEQTPVYAVVHASLRTQIFTGQYRPGDLLPSESHLCQEFGASRETVRRGLQQLENEGLIFSRPKIGYFVSQPNHNDMVLSLSEELEGTELQYRDIHGILPDERLQELRTGRSLNSPRYPGTGRGSRWHTMSNSYPMPGRTLPWKARSDTPCCRI